MPVQLNIFLLLFGGLQGLLLSLFLIRKKLHRNGYIFLLLYLGVMLLQITLKVMSKFWLWEHWKLLYDISYFLPLLYGPLIFLFVRHLLLNKKFRASDILHFFPFAFMFFNLFMHDSLFFSMSWAGFLYRVDAGLIVQVISLLIYHSLSLQYWRQHKNSLNDYFSEARRIQMGWVRQFIIVSFFVCTAVSLAIYLLYMNYPRGTGFRYGFTGLTIFIYWVSYTALTKPSVFSVIKGYNGTEATTILTLPKLIVHRPVKKYSNSGLGQEEMTAISSALQKVMQEKKAYLDPELTINDLAAMIKCNRHHLSQVMNESMQRSFYEYVNYYRVEEAKQLLCDTARAEHKIASIAFDAGFNSISTFNEVFKKFTGYTPSQFRKQLPQVSQKERV